MRVRLAPLFYLSISLPMVNVIGDALAQEVVTASAESASPAESQALQVEQIRNMVRSFGRKPSTPAQLVQLARGLEPQAAAGLFLQISNDFMQTGHFDLAATVLLQLLDRFPHEPISLDATLLLIQMYSSSEIAHIHRQTQDTARQLRLPPGWHKQSASAADTVDRSNSISGMRQYALTIANGQLQQHPDWAKQSPFAFQCAATARLSGQSQESKSWLTLLRHKRESAQWRTRALAETWLVDSPDQAAPLPTTRSLTTDTPPHLDGVLDESFWQSADSFAPHSELNDSKAEILLAYDAKFCYVAVRCQRIEGAQYASDNRPRTYDANLAGQDRILLRLDADRDYATCFEFTVDHRGWTADACWRNTSWNPQWFVAAASLSKSWIVEMAIPWSELTAESPRAGETWALSAERITPTQVSETALDDFRLLIFN